MIILKIAIILLVIWALIALSIVLINHTFLFLYLHIEQTMGLMQNPQRYRPVSIFIYIRNYWIELFYLLGKYYLYPFKFLTLTVNKNLIPNDTAVILIHGYCRNKTDWWWLRRHIASIDCPIYALNLQPKLASIEQICTLSLPKFVQQVKTETGCKQIILIGHSMGGLVASYYSEFLDSEGVISAVITLGTPYYGTKVSIAGAGENAREMCPDSEFSQELCARIAVSKKIYCQIASRIDNLVYPWYSALFKDTPSAQQLELANVPHLGLLHSKIVAAKLCEWIKEIRGLA